MNDKQFSDENSDKKGIKNRPLILLATLILVIVVGVWSNSSIDETGKVLESVPVMYINIVLLLLLIAVPGLCYPRAAYKLTKLLLGGRAREFHEERAKWYGDTQSKSLRYIIRCQNHPDRQAVGNCCKCKRTVCKECRTIIDNEIYCPECASTIEAKFE